MGPIKELDDTTKTAEAKHLIKIKIKKEVLFESAFKWKQQFFVC